MATVQPPPRAALYVDGFNLYHSILDHGEPWLKWSNLWRLGEILARPHKAQLVKVAFCTAVPDDQAKTRDNHITYNSALRAVGVTIVPGHHMFEPNGKRLEKQSDINLALELMFDAEDDVYDIAILLTADSDQAATARRFKKRFAQKKFIAIATLGRPVPEKIKSYTKHHAPLKLAQLEESIFPQAVAGLKSTIVRPSDYDPPSWWVHPDHRRKK
jgi:uncharacterized LabA/DUF88 family protein